MVSTNKQTITGLKRLMIIIIHIIIITGQKKKYSNKQTKWILQKKGLREMKADCFSVSEKKKKRKNFFWKMEKSCQIMYSSNNFETLNRKTKREKVLYKNLHMTQPMYHQFHTQTIFFFVWLLFCFVCEIWITYTDDGQLIRSLVHWSVFVVFFSKQKNFRCYIDGWMDWINDGLIDCDRISNSIC